MGTTKKAESSSVKARVIKIVLAVVALLIILLVMAWPVVGLEAGAIFVALLVVVFLAFFLVYAIGFTLYYYCQKKQLGKQLMKKMKMSLSYLKRGFDIFLKRPVEIVLLGLFLGVAMAAITTTWIRYLVAFVFFVIALALYKSYKREQDEERLAEKLCMEKEQNGYSD